jgi:hypothetical protein
MGWIAKSLDCVRNLCKKVLRRWKGDDISVLLFTPLLWMNGKEGRVSSSFNIYWFNNDKGV